MFNHQDYMKAKYGNLPTRTVTKQELKEALMNIGKTKDEAEFQVEFAEGLGSNVLVGNEFLCLTKEK